MAFDSSSRLLLGNDGGLWRFDPTVPSWANLNGNLNTIQFYGIGVHPTSTQTLIGGSRGNGTELTTGNVLWNLTLGGDGGFCQISQTNPLIVYATYVYGSLYVSTDGGNTFNSVAPPLNTSNFIAPIFVDSSNGNRVFVGADALYESTSEGIFWTTHTSPSTNLIDAVAVVPGGNTIYISTGGSVASISQIWLSSNDGASWTQHSLPAGGRVNELDIDPNDATGNTVIAVINTFNGASGQVYRTVNGGTAWTNISGNLTQVPTWSAKIDTDAYKTIFVSNETGVYSSPSPYGTWTAVGSGLPHAQGMHLELNRSLHLLALATHGRGAWYITPQEATAPPVVNKTFTPATIQSGGTSVVTLTLTNNNGTTLTGGAFTDTLTNMSAVAGAVAGTCTGTAPATLTAGQTALSFTGITIPASGSCTVVFSVTSSTIGSQNNTTSGVTTTQTPTPGAASNTATLAVVTCGVASGVLATTPNGTYGTTASIVLQVPFSSAVTVTGTPMLALNSGGSASYTSGSGSTALTFTYSVAGGQNSSHLDYSSVSALTLNGGTITGSGSCSPSLTLPSPGGTGSLGANSAITIDTTAPTVINVTSSTPNGAYATGNSISIQILLSKTVNVTGTPALLLNSGGTAVYASGSGSATLTFTYTIGASDSSSHLDYASTSALTLNGGTIKDTVSPPNAANLLLTSPGSTGSLGANKSFVINSPPDMTITKSHSGDFYPGQVGAIYTITASNVGSKATTGTVMMSDTLPTGLTATAISGGPNWNCTQPSGPCTRSDSLAPNASYQPITLTVNVALTAPSSVTNTATVSGGGETNTTNDTASDVTTILNNVTASITSFFPDTALAGGPAFTLYVSGSGFVSGAVVNWNSTPLTTFLNSGNLTANVPASLIASTGSASITVSNPGQGPSNAVSFSIVANPPVPNLTLADATYSFYSASGLFAGKFLLVSGSGFEQGMTLSWNGINLGGPVDAGLSVSVPLSLIQTPGLVSITATNPGGTPSTAFYFNVPPLRTLTSISPATVAAGSSSFTLTVNGTGFASGDSITVWPGGFDLTTTFISSTQLQATVPASALASNGTLQVWVSTIGSSSSFASTNELPLTVGTGGPVLSISATHSGNFVQGEQNATYTITVSNASGAGSTSSKVDNGVTIVSRTNTLVSLPGGPPSPSGGAVTVNEYLPAGLFLVSMSGANWTCASNSCSRSDALGGGNSYDPITVTVNVSSTSPSPVANIVTVSGGGAPNETATDITIVNSSPTITKAFNPTSIQSGGTSAVTLTLSNSNSSALTGGAFTDTLVTMSAAGGAVTGTCAGTTPSSLTTGATALSFTGITIPANSSCTVIFSVTSKTPGAQNNITSGVTTTQIPTPGATSNTATLTVLTAPGIAEAFNPTSIQAGATSVVILTLTNSNAFALTGGAFSDTLVNMGASAGAVGGTCAGTTPSSLTAGQTTLGFSGIMIPPNSGCTVTFSVTSSTLGAQPNTTSGVTTTQTPTAGTVSNTATLTVGSAGTVVNNVTSSTANGTYGAGSSISIQVVFSNPVTVTGTPKLALNSGGTANYSSGSGTNTLTFLYTVGATDNSAHLDYASTSALTPNGGTISASLTLPAPGTAGSLSANTNLIIDQGPVVTQLSPAVSTGATQSYTFQFSDPVGYQNLNVLNILINTALDGRQGCYLAYVEQSNTLYLVDDGGDAGGPYASLVLNGSESVNNSQCTINGVGSSASGSGNTLTLILNMSFSTAFGGNKVVYMAARNTGQQNSGWQTMGVHGVTPLPSTFPMPVSMSPSSGSTANPTLTFTFQDATSASNLQTGWALINTAINGISSCYVAYYRPGNQVYLYPDNGDGTQATSMVLTGTNTLSNSQCTVSAQGSSVTTSGAQLIVSLNISFTPAFAGPKGVWMAAQTTGGAQTSAWQALGAWSVP